MLTRISVPASVAAIVLAGVVAVSATTGAVAGSLVTGAQVANGSLTGKDVKDGSLKTADLAAKTRTALTGPPGPTGAVGPAGPPGVNTLRVVTRFASVPANTPTTVSAECPTGQKATGGAGWLFNAQAPALFVLTDNLGQGIASTPGSSSPDQLIARVICVPTTTVVEDNP